MTEEGKKFVSYMMPILNENQRRYFLGAVSDLYGYGSITELSKLTKVSRVTITKGAKDYLNDIEPDPTARCKPEEIGRIRAPGAGRKAAEEMFPDIEKELEVLLDGNVIGDPESFITWTSKSLINLSDELKAKGINVGKDTVGRLLKKMGFSLHQNQKYIGESDGGPDRDRQFRFINGLSKASQEKGNPVISCDTKKKELIGNYKNGGAEYGKSAIKVNAHDFPDPEKGRISPYGVYDISRNEGYVNLGVSADTGLFAANGIRNWWYAMGEKNYAEADEIVIMCDGGGSNGSRTRLWKVGLQELADEIGKGIRVCHYPPGTSKWNKIEHRMFSYISMNWRAKPLESIEYVVELITHTTTKTGLRIQCKVDPNKYDTGIKVSDETMRNLNLVRNTWRGDWNYLILPTRNASVDPHASEGAYNAPPELPKGQKAVNKESN